MAKAQVETANPENETDSEDDGPSFEDRLKLTIANMEIDEPGTKDHPPIYRWAEGTTQEALAEKLGYNKVSSFTVGMGSIRDFVRFDTMTVEHEGSRITGQKLRQKLGKSRVGFVEYCKEQQKSTKPTFTVVKPGIEIPKFRNRGGEAPDVLSLMGDLIGSVQEGEEAEE